MSIKKYKYEGHRKRLRNKFSEVGLEALHDYEVIELLLTLGTPRKDCKDQAKEAIKKFKNLQGVLDASLKELQEIKGIGQVNAFGIKLFQAISERYLKNKILGKEVVLKSPESVIDYLCQSMKKEKEEVLKILYLNNSNKILDVQELFRGTVNQAVIYPREVVKRALEKGATRIILAHNHPAGNPKPSEHDLEITFELKNACASVQIEILDHIIIGEKEHYSFHKNNQL